MEVSVDGRCQRKIRQSVVGQRRRLPCFPPGSCRMQAGRPEGKDERASRSDCSSGRTVSMVERASVLTGKKKEARKDVARSAGIHRHWRVRGIGEHSHGCIRHPDVIRCRSARAHRRLIRWRASCRAVRSTCWTVVAYAACQSYLSSCLRGQCAKKACKNCRPFGFHGGEEEDRTPDLRIANATLSQLSYPPNVSANSNARHRACQARCLTWFKPDPQFSRSEVNRPACRHRRAW